jgi:hypothetical protein
MECWIRRGDPQVRVVLHKGIGAVQKLKHAEEPILAYLFNLLTAHYLRVFGRDFPEKAKFDDC